MKPSETNSGSVERQLFVRALEKPAGDARAAFLDGACGDNPDLRRRLEALLRKFETLGTFLEEPAVPPLDSSHPSAASDSSTQTVPVKASSEKPGHRIGRYKLLQMIGEGGCGVVYMAEQEEPVRRRVALKVIKLGMDTRQVIARFEAERQALAMMDHPNIAKVLDAGATETGGPYFVMELVRGIKITEYCDQNNLPTRQRLDLFIPVCQAIQHAHQKGIIHRDIKPSNILVTLHDGVPVPKVIDFGIAKATEGRLTDQTLFTAFEQFIGTPAYMSPEQAEMSGLDIDTRSDIYSLGVLLYELLTGRTPLDTKELFSVGLDELRRTIREKDPMRPSTRLRSLVEEEKTTAAKRRGVDVPKLIHLLSGDLDWIVMKCLEKDRTRRYETANGLAMDLQRHLNDEAVTARPPSQFYRFNKLVRRNKLAFTAATAVAAALVFGIVVSSWQAVRASRASQQAQANLRKAVIAEQGEAKQGQLAQEQRQVALNRARELRRHLYVGDIRSAYQAIREGEIAHAKQLIERQFPKPGEEDLRGFEWRYLWNLCQPNYQSSFPADGQTLEMAVFSPDGKLLAGWDLKLVVVFDVASRGLVRRFQPFGDKPECTRNVAFSRDGRLFAAKVANQVRVWRVNDWQEILHLSEAKPNLNAGTALVVSPDAKVLATPVEGGVGFWDLKNGERILGPSGGWPTLPGDSFLGMRMAYSSDGTMLAISDTASIQVRDAHSLRMITNLARMIAGDGDWRWRVLSIAFSTNFLAAGYRDGELRLWETKNWSEVTRVKPHATFLETLDFSPDGKLLATGAEQEHVVHLWDVKDLIESRSDSSSPSPRITLKGLASSINSACFSPDGHLLAAGSIRDGTTKLWDVDSGFGSALDLDGALDVLWIAPDGKRLITVNQDGKLDEWEDSDVLHSRPFSPTTAASIDCPRAISPDGKTLALGRPDSAIELWDLANGSRTDVFRPVRPAESEFVGIHHPWENGDGQIEFAAEGSLLVSFGDGDGIRIRDLADSTKQSVFTNLAGPFALSPDGAVLAAPRRDGQQIQLWNVAKKQFQAALDLRTGTFWGTAADGIAFSPDGRFLIVASSRVDSIQLWDLQSRHPIKKLPMPKPTVDSMVFSFDMKTLLIQSHDNTITFWNVATWEELFKEPNYAPNAGKVLFSKDGSALALPGKLSASGRSSYRLWRAPSLVEIDAKEHARAVTTSSLSN